MPVAALSPDTVRSIGSTQVLTDSCSVVKELIDNSIDARASAIFIEVSVNALDVIQVKDNGHGILPDDRRMACRPHCTSKLRYFDDLKDIGGKSLGFRGVALASAAEISGGMVISTRIEGETTAVSLTINRQGEIEKEVRVSQPVGTTVRITELMKKLPVRRQTALKASAKSIAKIRRLLHAYAYARPSLRLSLKVLKAKNDKSNWVYAPASGDTVLDAALKIGGSKLVDQCQWRVWKSSVNDNSSIADVETNENNGRFYKIEALLPSPTCDTSVVNNAGHYISIDSRPVSCTRGTLKQIISLYRSYLGSGCLVEGTNLVKDPFFCMNLVCPSTSYDVNIEPAKDDILFINADSVIGIFVCFLKTVYGELRTPSSVSTQSSLSDQRPRGFDVLFASKPQMGSKIPKQLVHNAQNPNNKGDNASSIASAGIKPAHNKCHGLPQRQSSLSDQRPRGFDVLFASKPQMGSKIPKQLVHNAQNSNNKGDNASSIASAGIKPAQNKCHGLPQRKDSQAVSVQDYEEVVAITSAVPNQVSESVSESSVAGQRQGWQHDMYGVDEDGVDNSREPEDDDSQLQESQASDERTELRDASISNPWAFAKLNAPLHRSNIARRPVPNVEGNDQLLTPGRQAGELGNATAPQVQEILRASNTLNFSLPTPVREKGYEATSSQFSSSPEPDAFPEKNGCKIDRRTASSKHKPSQKTTIDCGALDTWVQRSTGSRFVMNHSIGPFDGDNQDSNVHIQTPTRDFVSARALPLDPPLNAITERAPKSTRNGAPGKKTKTDINKPFVSPLNGPLRLLFDMEPQEKDRRSQPVHAKSVVDAIAASNDSCFSREDQDSVIESGPTRSSSPVHPDIAATMDYEIRKQAAIQHWKANQHHKALAKDFVPSSEDEPSRSSAKTAKTTPHQNRYRRAVANLHSPVGEAASPEPQIPSFEPGDPRAYLLRAQKCDETTYHDFPHDFSKRPQKRKKTGLLPFETIPEDRSTCDLILTLGGEVGLKDRLRLSVKGGTSFWDEYIGSGTTVGAFSSCTIHHIHAWEAKLRELVGNLRYGTEGKNDVANEKTDCLRLDIWTALQTHRTTTHSG